MINKFVNRLAKIGIQVTLTGNYPWVYLNTVNGNRVKDTFKANHGYTIFWLQQDGSYKIADRHDAFKTIRKYL